MKTRTAKWFVSAILKQASSNPTQPARIDYKRTERNIVSTAYRRLLEDQCRDAIGGDIKGWRPEYRMHPDPELRAQGYSRAAFYGPNWEGPQPIETFTRTVKRTDQKETWPKHIERDERSVRKKMGVEYYVKATPIYPAENESLTLRYDVWHGEDGLRLECSAFFPSEVAAFLEANIRTLEVMRPMAQQVIRRNAAHKLKPGGSPKKKNEAEETLTMFCERHQGTFDRVFEETNSTSKGVDEVMKQPGCVWGKRRLTTIFDPKRKNK